jgi:polysaccharide pyruvyl transferase WcaK-like protein
MLASLLQMLPESVTPLVLSGNPAETRKRYGYKLRSHSLLPSVQAMRHSRAFIWGGGSLIQDVTSAASPLYYGGLWVGTTTRLKNNCLGAGNWPLKRDLTRRVARQCLRGVQR